MNNRKGLLAGILLLVIFIGSVIYVINYNISEKNKIDDYYKYINGEKIDKRKIEDGEVGWSYLNDKQEEIDKEIDELTKNMLDTKENSKMNAIYDVYKSSRRNSEGITPLNKYLNMIDNSNNINELLNAIYSIDGELKLGLLLNPKISKDFKDADKYLLYLYPISNDFGVDIQFYSNPDYSSYKALVSKYRIRLLKLNGYEAKKARGISNNINSILESIAKESKQTDDYNDIGTYYNIITKKELKEIMSNIDLDKYLSSMNLSDVETFSIVDSDNYKAFNKYINNDNLTILKEFFKLRIATNYLEVLSDDYRNIVKGLNNEMNGVAKETDAEEEALDMVEAIFSDYISYKYAKDNFTEKNKQDIDKLIKKILSYYKKEIDSNDFLTKETKEKAITKLNNIKVRIGYPEESVIYSNNYNISTNDNLFTNLNRINNYLYKVNLEYLKTNEESKNWPYSLTTINAFYNPQDNSINFPAALFKIIDDNNSEYELLGSVGLIVAHEITHAFDNNGSLFDEKGELNNWWTEKDRKAFNEKTEKVVNYYNKYTVLGMNVDGEKTLGENIADLGAIKCITKIAEENEAKEDDYKTMYKAFANFFLGKYIDSYTKLVAAFDVHSPNDVRVNATLSSTDKFYDVFKINSYDKMYVEENSRVSVW